MLNKVYNFTTVDAELLCKKGVAQFPNILKPEMLGDDIREPPLVVDFRAPRNYAKKNVRMLGIRELQGGLQKPKSLV